MTRGIECYGDLTRIRTLKFDELTKSSQDLAAEYLRALPIDGTHRDLEEEFNVDWEVSTKRASAETYVVAEPTVFQSESRVATPGDSAREWTAKARWSDFYCSVPMSALVSDRGERTTVQVPGILMRSNFTQGRTFSNLARTFDFADSDQYRLVESSTPVNESIPGRLRVSKETSSWEWNEPISIGLNPASLTFEPEGADAARQRAALWAGIAAAVIATLTVSLLKMMGDWIATRIPDRRRRPPVGPAE